MKKKKQIKLRTTGIPTRHLVGYTKITLLQLDNAVNSCQFLITKDCRFKVFSTNYVLIN